jgi:hypothetical protein
LKVAVFTRFPTLSLLSDIGRLSFIVTQTSRGEVIEVGHHPRKLAVGRRPDLPTFERWDRVGPRRAKVYLDDISGSSLRQSR